MKFMFWQGQNRILQMLLSVIEMEKIKRFKHIHADFLSLFFLIFKIFIKKLNYTPSNVYLPISQSVTSCSVIKFFFF